MNRWKALLVAVALMLTGCGSVPVEHYRDERPALDLQKY
jgi:starvation-inducible outer membrane lipoprotein